MLILTLTIFFGGEAEAEAEGVEAAEEGGDEPPAADEESPETDNIPPAAPATEEATMEATDPDTTEQAPAEDEPPEE